MRRKEAAENALLDFSQLLRELQRWAGRLALRYSIPPGVIDDLLAATLLKMYAKQAQIRNPRNWFISAFRNACRNYLRQEGRRAKATRGFRQLSEQRRAGPSEEEVIIRRLDLDRAIAQLPATGQAVIRAFYFEGTSWEETGRQHGLAPLAVKRALRRSRHSLAKLLSGTRSSSLPGCASTGLDSDCETAADPADTPAD